MPSTYTLISSNVLASSAASVTFSAIPSTYTDLVLRLSTRISEADTKASLYVQYNSSTTAAYSRTRLIGDGSTASSSRASNSATGLITVTDATNATANTFGSTEIYIPNYAGSTNKPASVDSRSENNATEAYTDSLAWLWSNTAAITSITIYGNLNAGSFVSGSSFYLYGIKKS